jgi:hypothetical protein
MSFKPRDYLRHILVEADYLLGLCAGLRLEGFDSLQIDDEEIFPL